MLNGTCVYSNSSLVVWHTTALRVASQLLTATNRLLLASESYYHVLSKKKDNEALDDAEKLLPIDALGIVMIVHGEEFGDESTFGMLFLYHSADYSC